MQQIPEIHDLMTSEKKVCWNVSSSLRIPRQAQMSAAKNPLVNGSGFFVFCCMFNYCLNLLMQLQRSANVAADGRRSAKRNRAYTDLLPAPCNSIKKMLFLMQ